MPNPADAVLSVSSHVVRGCVGNRAMVIGLERLGFTVHSVPTVLLPHHPGHGPAQRIAISDNDFAALLEDLSKPGNARDIAAIVSGYLATSGQAEALAQAIAKVKAERPGALYLCDPVLGDGDRLYVAKDLAEAIRDLLLPIADAATPNAFECAWLAGANFSAGDDVSDIVALARRLPPPVVLVTSTPAMIRGQIGNLLVTQSETLLFEHPRAATKVKGTGDLLSAVLLARRLQGSGWPRAAELALSSVLEITAGTAQAGADELMLAKLQAALVDPQPKIAVRTLGSGALTQDGS